MGDNTTIEWTDATWNPVRGCSIVSKGCTNCYAMRQAHRSHGAGGAYEGLTKLTKGGPVWTGEIREVDELLTQPLKWQRPRRIFVNSMSDLFHEDVPDDFIAKVFEVMNNAPQHIYQVLTKRPQRMRAMLSKREWPWAVTIDKLPQPNLWLGVSVEDQERAYERIPLLLQTPAAVRWISAEPLLGPIDLRDEPNDIGEPRFSYLERVDGEGPRLDWVVAGGESGPGARPMHPDWARSLRDQCDAAGVPFFFKQWGNYLPGELKRGDPILRWQNGATQWYGDDADIRFSECWLTNDENGLCIAVPTTKKKAGRQLDGRTHDEYPA